MTEPIICNLGDDDQLLWNEVNELLKDNQLKKYKHVYAITSKKFDFTYLHSSLLHE